MLLPGNVNDGIISTDGIERVVREGQGRQVLAHEVRLWYQLPCQPQLLFGKVYADDHKTLSQDASHRHARPAPRIEDCGPLRQPPDEVLQ